ncbi:hypothetical protein ACH5RR_004711 [Cinchona calisaya]|uniref:Uncharacterized protein n=1 Tax=Cinchona calisaya TaxID=153742 RepID=A0ABD3AYE4_9GENT
MDSLNWFIEHDRVKVYHIKNEASDHSMIVLDILYSLEKKKRRFQFDRRWFMSKEPEKIIADVWKQDQDGSKMYKVSSKIKKCRLALLQWIRKLTRMLEKKSVRSKRN